MFVAWEGVTRSAGHTIFSRGERSFPRSEKGFWLPLIQSTAALTSQNMEGSSAPALTASASTVMPYGDHEPHSMCNGTYVEIETIYWGDGADAFPAYWRILCLVIATIDVVGNAGVIAWRALSKKEQRNSIPSMLVINLAISDLLFGIHFLIYVLMNSSLLCFVWVSPVSVPLMKSLCVICGFLETACIFASAMIGITIAFYYATVVFGRFCCTKCFSRRCVAIFLCIEWLIAVIASAYSVIVTSEEYGILYRMERQEVYDSSRVTNQLIPDNSTFSIIRPQSCLSTVSYLGPTETFNIYLFIVYVAMGCLVLMTTGTYLAIAIRLLVLKVSHAFPRNLSKNVGGLNARLVAVSLIALMGWIAAVVTSYIFGLTSEVILPFAVVGLSNPLTFTLTSQPFLNAVKRLKQKVCFKIGRPIPIENVNNDSESLLPSRLPASDTN